MSRELCAIDSMSICGVEQDFLRDSSELWMQGVEDAFYLHPAIRECVVMKDQINGEGLIAFVTLQAELTGREQELRDWIRYTIGDSRVPERIVILPELPKVPPGILNRSALRDLILSLETGLDVVDS